MLRGHVILLHILNSYVTASGLNKYFAIERFVPIDELGSVGLVSLAILVF